MILQLKTKGFADKLVEEVVKSALRDQADLAQLRFQQFENECRAFEERFKMTSEEFAREFDNGELGDAEEWFDWFAALRGLETWKVKSQVLKELSA